MPTGTLIKITPEPDISKNWGKSSWYAKRMLQNNIDEFKFVFEPDSFTVEEIVQKLNQGVTINFSCHEKNSETNLKPTTNKNVGVRRFSNLPKDYHEVNHYLRFNPDGSVTMFNHDDIAPQGLSSLMNIEQMKVVTGLGGYMAPCVRFALWVEMFKENPENYSQAANFTGVQKLSQGYSINNDAISLYTGVAWAQPDLPVKGEPNLKSVDGEPIVWPADAIESYMNSGATPQVLSYWVNHGWKTQDAILFMRHNATFEVADQWRKVGRISSRSADFARAGHVPADEKPWLDMGFTLEQTYQWKMGLYQSKYTPAQAWEWVVKGVDAAQVLTYEELPKNEQEAHQKWMQQNPKRQYPHPDPTLDCALKWVREGVRNDHVLSWVRQLGSTDEALAITLKWSPYVTAQIYMKMTSLIDNNGNVFVKPEDIQRVQRIFNFPINNADLIVSAVQTGLDNQTLLRPLNMAAHGKRWLGIETRIVLEKTLRKLIKNQRENEHTKNQPYQTRYNKETWERIEGWLDTEDWDKILNYMRMYGESKIKESMWEAYLNWLKTNPKPPAWGPEKS